MLREKKSNLKELLKFHSAKCIDASSKYSLASETKTMALQAYEHEETKKCEQNTKKHAFCRHWSMDVALDRMQTLFEWIMFYK